MNNINEVYYISKPNLTTENLPLIIKRYNNKDAFSAFIHDSNHSLFEILGPNVKYK